MYFVGKIIYSNSLHLFSKNALGSFFFSNYHFLLRKSVKISLEWSEIKKLPNAKNCKIRRDFLKKKFEERI